MVTEIWLTGRSLVRSGNQPPTLGPLWENPLDDGDEEVISVVPRPCRTSTTSIFGSDIGGLVHDVIERYIWKI
jgi:hypothetical protein